MMKTTKLLLALLLLTTLNVFAAPASKFSINLHPVKLSELVRLVYSDLLKKNYVLDGAFLADGSEVSINWQDLPLSQIDKMTRDLIQSKGYVITEFSKVLFIKPIDKIDDELLIYPVRFRSAKYLTDMISRLTGDSQAGSRGLPPPSTGTPAIPDGGAVASVAQVFDHSALDQIIYTCSASECKRIKNLLTQLDTSEPNVILHAFVYEVTLIRGQASALDIVASLRYWHGFISYWCCRSFCFNFAI
jgi:type II secretory pathway component GspD/PulD (secretin)